MSITKSFKRIARKAQRIPENIRIALNEQRMRAKWLSAKEIAEYRKTIKIYDVFTFFNELDLLEIRLGILDPYVDFFVIVESTQTFSGTPKPLHFKENRDRFAKWLPKIIYHAVEDAPKGPEELRARLDNPNLREIDREIISDTLASGNVGADPDNNWLREFYIKDSVRKPLAEANLSDTDFCYISDLDEIWDPELLIDYSKDDIFKPLQKCYMYYLNNRSDEHWWGWTGTIATKYKNLRHKSSNDLRTHKYMKHRYAYLRNGGWHFTFQGGLSGAERKIVESNHFWYNAKATLPALSRRVSENIDFRGRNIKLWVDNRGLPKYLLENREKFKRFFK